jgi:hypothetical protein
MSKKCLSDICQKKRVQCGIYHQLGQVVKQSNVFSYVFDKIDYLEQHHKLEENF